VEPLLAEVERILGINTAHLHCRKYPCAYRHDHCNGEFVALQSAEVLDSSESAVCRVVADDSSVHVVFKFCEHHWCGTGIACHLPHRIWKKRMLVIAEVLLLFFVVVVFFVLFLFFVCVLTTEL